MTEPARQPENTKAYMVITDGMLVAHYRVIERIATGGMGEVYLAEDTELDRPVALKFLPLEYAFDEDFKTRFTREAQATAALIHPSIVTIHGVSDYNGRPYIVMEHVEGQSLREVLRATELPIREIIHIAIQVCEGLRKAHETGIIHRDIKPANIVIDSEGQPKLLDFGLASVDGESKLTRTGTALGTVGYMSPEQLSGKPPDQRTDLFSFGVVLYEMLTGRSPFKRESDGSTLQAVLNESPEPLARYKSGLPDGFQRIVDKALEKNCETRYQHADDLLADLKRLRDELSQPSVRVVVSQPASRTHKAIWVVATMIFALAAGTLLIRLTRREETPAIVDVEATWKRITFCSDAASAAISPSGELIAYVRGRSPEPQRVMIQDLSGGQPLEVYADQTVKDLRWSPDGNHLLYEAGNDSAWGACRISRLGGRPQRYAFGGVSGGYAVGWSPDGHRLAVATPECEIRFTDPESGRFAPERLGLPFERVDNLEWSPTGQLLLFRTVPPEDVALWIVCLDGRVLTRVATGEVASPRWSPEGDAVYYLCQSGELEDLLRLPVDPELGTPRGHPEPVITRMQTDGNLSITRDGRRLLYVRDLTPSNLWLINVTGTSGSAPPRTKQLTSGIAQLSTPSISPDGRRVAFASVTPDGGRIHTMPIEGGDRQLLCGMQGPMRSPVWSPDGRRIAFCSQASVGIVAASGGVPVTVAHRPAGHLAWAPGRSLLHQSEGDQGYVILDPRSGRARPLVVNDSLGPMFDARYSPDGNLVAVDWNRFREDEQGRWINESGLWVISPRDSTQTFVAPGRYFHLVGWSADSRWIYARSHEGASIVRIEVATGEIDTIAQLPFNNLISAAMTTDGTRFVCEVGEAQADVWLVEDFDPDRIRLEEAQ